MSIVVSGLCKALAEKGIYLTEKQFQEKVRQFSVKTGMPQWFLNEKSELTHIPSNRMIHGKQHKCFQILKVALSDETVQNIEEGIVELAVCFVNLLSVHACILSMQLLKACHLMIVMATHLVNHLMFLTP